jgi:hypothetical protein
LYFLIYQSERTSQGQTAPPSDKVPLYATFALTMGVRGFIDVGVWMINQDVIITPLLCLQTISLICGGLIMK